MLFGNYERYVGDAARGCAAPFSAAETAYFSYAHDLAVQETVLRASGRTVES